MITKTGIHALAALAELAKLPRGCYMGAAELADRIDAPRNYLGKLLMSLSQEGILESQKGKGGGFRLARSPEAVSLYDVIETIEHLSRWNGCFLGRPRCSGESPCAVHQRWGPIRDAYLDFLRDTRISDLAPQRSSSPADGDGSGEPLGTQSKSTPSTELSP
ncbi:MAG: Rrf2 family transcriptional regulator [Thermoguttaceae bacterium]|jgi:Rrf2 family protein|nr:Rrf2 family transcriptional regulator [Thermoguttaceae bacterium]